MNHIYNGVYLGDSLDAKLQMECKAVLNCAFDLHIQHDPQKTVAVSVGLRDGPGNPGALYLLAADVLENLYHRFDSVLVHCHEGKSRSAAVVVMWLMKHRSKSLSEALVIVQTHRKVAIHPVHIQVLEEYEKIFRR